MRSNNVSGSRLFPKDKKDKLEELRILEVLLLETLQEELYWIAIEEI